MNEYYNRPEITQYFAKAHSFNEVWSERTDHWMIRDAAKPGMAVLDMGCGSGHSWINLRDRGLRYTGLDVSANQIARNVEAYGREPTFVAKSLYDTELPTAGFDLTFSTFVLEHLVWPHRFLAEIGRLTRPGGLMIILCPDFRCAGRIPSLPYGRTVATMKQRLRSGKWLAAIRHLYLRNIRYPRILAKHYPPALFPFLINTKPTCLTGPYYPDNDAVYFADRAEVVATLCRLGARDVTQGALSAAMRPNPPEGQLVVVARRI